MKILCSLCRPIATALFIVLGSVGGAGADNLSLQQKVNACHSLVDRDARIACYDGLAEPVAPGAALKVPLVPAASTPQAPAMPNAAPAPMAMSAPAAPAPSSAAAPAPVAQTSESLRSDDEVLLSVASVAMMDSNRLRLVMSDGITWEQTQDRPIHDMPAPGDVVKISRGALGYTCKLNKRDKFHCKPPYGLDGKMRSE